MTEEIIIDGVDVAGCEYMLNNKIKGKQQCPMKSMPYAKETSCICRKSISTPYNFCKHNPDCHYKQLKRLEQERDELKQENERLKDKAIHFEMANDIKKQEIDSLREYLERLEQENKELKEKYSHVLELAKTNADSNEYCLQELEKENKKLLEARNHFMGVNLKYFNALEEIREIANENNFCASYACPPMFKILDKINEVLEC